MKGKPQIRNSQFTIRNTNIFITPATLFMIAWLVIMISIPIIGWVGEDYFEIGVMAGVLMQACTVLTILQQAWGTVPVIKLAALLLPITWLLEYVGSHHGLPFGNYYYTNLLTPLIGGVPLIIPIAWMMILPVCWGVATAILDTKTRRQEDMKTRGRGVNLHPLPPTHYALRFLVLRLRRRPMYRRS